MTPPRSLAGALSSALAEEKAARLSLEAARGDVCTLLKELRAAGIEFTRVAHLVGQHSGEALEPAARVRLAAALQKRFERCGTTVRRARLPARRSSAPAPRLTSNEELRCSSDDTGARQLNQETNSMPQVIKRVTTTTEYLTPDVDDLEFELERDEDDVEEIDDEADEDEREKKRSTRTARRK